MNVLEVRRLAGLRPRDEACGVLGGRWRWFPVAGCKIGLDRSGPDAAQSVQIRVAQVWTYRISGTEDA